MKKLISGYQKVTFKIYKFVMVLISKALGFMEEVKNN